MIVLQIYFQIEEHKEKAFEEVYRRYYVPALQKQIGYLGSNLLKVYPPEVASEFDASTTEYDYQIELMFDSEADRRIWASSMDHNTVWGMVKNLFIKAQWRGYDFIANHPFKNYQS